MDADDCRGNRERVWICGEFQLYVTGVCHRGFPMCRPRKIFRPSSQYLNCRVEAGEYAVGVVVVLMCGEEIGYGEDGHASGFSRLDACCTVFKYDAGFGWDIEFCGGFEVDFWIGFGMGDVAARKNSAKNVVERVGIYVGQDAILKRGTHALARCG